MKAFDDYEISPCKRHEDRPGHYYFEVCEPHEADVWTLYGHLPEGGVEAIGDFATREYAEETFQRITGIPFTGAGEVAARLRLMHAGPKMLAALKEALAEIVHWHADMLTPEERNHPRGSGPARVYDSLQAAIAEAEGRVPHEAGDQLTKADLLAALTKLAHQADEACPLHHRTRHFVGALDEAKALLADLAGRTA